MSEIYQEKLIEEIILSLPNQRIEFLENEYFFSNGFKEFLKNEELLLTIKEFLKNDLNVLKTSKKTFMHRNTLLYRIEKVKKLTGLDARCFEDAVVLEILISLNKVYKKDI
ncbi:MAG: helix-turn-helix domain-containing protein [Clostridia bacterium]|nr:helix-turn-helix domain-containing protein [Clostridia bacterium]